MKEKAFEVNDKVIYSGKGVCIITAIEKMDLCGESKLYYILKPVYHETSTVYLPTDNKKLLSKMKRVLTKKEVDDIIINIKDQKMDWIDNKEERRSFYQAILSEANRSKILAAIRCIHQKQASSDKRHGKPHLFDIQFMQENERIITEEFAIALGIQPNEVEGYIEGLLETVL